MNGFVLSYIAATSLDTCMILSSFSTCSIEDVAQASGTGLRWFQMYIFADKEFTTNLIQRAEQAGYRALVITVDTPVLGRRLASCRNAYHFPSHLELANFKPDVL